MRRFFERIDLVDAFAGEASLAVEILINVGDGGRIWIDARMPRVDRSEVRAVCARQRHSDPRLYDAVAFRDAPDSFVVVGTIQRMGDRPYQ